MISLTQQMKWIILESHSLNNIQMRYSLWCWNKEVSPQTFCNYSIVFHGFLCLLFVFLFETLKVLWLVPFNTAQLSHNCYQSIYLFFSTVWFEESSLCLCISYIHLILYTNCSTLFKNIQWPQKFSCVLNCRLTTNTLFIRNQLSTTVEYGSNINLSMIKVIILVNNWKITLQLNLLA